jgi:hypothetical protein
MVCFRYIIVNTLHKGDNKDDDDDNNIKKRKISSSPLLPPPLWSVFTIMYLKKTMFLEYSGPLTYELNSFARAGRKSRLFFP